jgi:hypothetical protein
VTETIEAEPIPLPCCPHCGKDIELPALYNWQAEAAAQIILAAYCPNIDCRKILHLQILIIQPAANVEPLHLHRHM